MEKIRIDEFLNFRFLSEPQLNPSGTAAAFVMSAVCGNHLIPLFDRQRLGEAQRVTIAAVGPQSQYIGLVCLSFQGDAQAVQVVGSLGGIGGVIAGIVLSSGGFAEKGPL